MILTYKSNKLVKPIKALLNELVNIDLKSTLRYLIGQQAHGAHGLWDYGA